MFRNQDLGGRHGDTAVDGEAVVVRVRNSRKVEIESCSEVYYPAINIVRSGEVGTSSLSEMKTEPVAQAEVAKLAEKVVKTEESGEIVRRRHGWKTWGSRLATLAVVVVAICAVVLVGLRLAGFRTFTVMSGSMEPNYPVGSMLYVRPVDYHTLKVGDVISYVANDDKVVVTHRIAEIVVDENDANVWRFRTKGDANESPDANLVHYKNVLGKPAIVIPHIGYFAHNIQQPPGIYIMLVVGTLLLAWTFLPGTLEERRKTARKSIA